MLALSLQMGGFMFYDEEARIDEDDWRRLLTERDPRLRIDEHGLLTADRRYHGKTEWTGEDRRVQNLRDQADN